MQPPAIAALAIGAGLLAGCADRFHVSDSANVFPLDGAMIQSGRPQVEFVGQGIGNRPVKVTMPDGEILRGEYRITDRAAPVSTTPGYGSGRATVINATGDRGTVMSCEGATDGGGHGAAICDAGLRGKFRITY